MSKTFNLEEYDTIVINDLSLNGSFLTNFQVGVPIGTILPWQDINTIPDGWKLCDGNGTYTDISGITRQIPDLRSKFIIGHDTRDTSFNIDTSGSSFVYRESDSDPDKPRSAFALANINDDPLNSSDMYKNVYYSLAYIIRVSNPNISTDTAGDKIINGNLTTSGKLIANGDLSANGNLFANGDLSANGNLFVNGNVGIGTTSPNYRLHIHNPNDATSFLQLTHSTSGTIGSSGAQFFLYGADTFLQNTNTSGDIRFRTAGYNDRMTIDHAGKVGIGTTSPHANLQIGYYTIGSFEFYNVSGVDNYYRIRMKNMYSRYWDIAHRHDQGNDVLLFQHSGHTKGYVDINRNSVMNFTGQHRTFIQNVPASQADDYAGLIVIANHNTYIDMSKQITPVYGKNAITINECLPKVSLCEKEEDKRVFGVISGKEDLNQEGERRETNGNFISVFDATLGDKRTFINSVGEGAIWVTNKNGNLESGDYITSSSILGYGQKQDSIFIANYTVAKITMDCDFQPSLQFIKEIRTININFTSIDNNNNYYHATTNELIYTKPYDEENNGIDVYRNKKYNLIVDESDNLVSVTQNILDSNGEIQWEDTTEQEYAYEIRYVDPSGNILTKEQHDSTILNGGSAYIAAFVGCTYHCG